MPVFEEGTQVHGGGGGAQFAKVTKDNNQSVSAGNFDIRGVEWDVELFDQTGGYDFSLSPSAWVAPADGLVQITTKLRLNDADHDDQYVFNLEYDGDGDSVDEYRTGGGIASENAIDYQWQVLKDVTAGTEITTTWNSDRTLLGFASKQEVLFYPD